MFAAKDAPRSNSVRPWQALRESSTERILATTRLSSRFSTEQSSPSLFKKRPTLFRLRHEPVKILFQNIPLLDQLSRRRRKLRSIVSEIPVTLQQRRTRIAGLFAIGHRLRKRNIPARQRQQFVLRAGVASPQVPAREGRHRNREARQVPACRARYCPPDRPAPSPRSFPG